MLGQGYALKSSQLFDIVKSFSSGRAGVLWWAPTAVGRRKYPVGMTPPSRPPASALKKGTLAAVVGAVAAAALLSMTPADESGRKVVVVVDPDGSAVVKHVSGRQYLNAYLDIAGVATACDGITRGVKLGQSYTEAQCAALLERELVVHAQGVMSCTPSLNAPERTWQRVAAVSHGYQYGVAAWCGSTAKKLIDAGKITAACDEFPKWNKARVGGKLVPVRGLELRGQRRREYCRTDQPGYPLGTLQQRLERWR
jgi:lysozyme